MGGVASVFSKGSLFYGYRTTADLVINHKGLGILRLVLQCLVLIYVAVSIIVFKKFAVWEKPSIVCVSTFDNVGASYIRSNYSALPYCRPEVFNDWNFTLPGNFQFRDYKCRPIDSALIIGTPTNQVTVGTFSISSTRVNGVASSTDLDCTFFPDAELIPFNLALSVTTSWLTVSQISARFIDSQGNVFREAKDGSFGGLRVKDFLYLAGISLEDVNKQVWTGLPGFASSQTPPYRLTGAYLVATVTFNNLNGLSFGAPTADITVHVIPRLWGVTSPSAFYQNYPSSYQVKVHSNIQIVFVAGGLLGYFDLPTLVLNLLSGVVLFGSISTVIDLLARCLLGDLNRGRLFKLKDSMVELNFDRTDVTGVGQINLSSASQSGNMQFHDLEKASS
jgi:hypothetical protein